MTIKLYGTSISNYFSTAKVALLEKNLDFEEVSVFPGDDPKVLALSPMGKVPYLEIDGKPLSETNVIFDYLEDVAPAPALYPADPWERAKTKEIIRTIENYLDLPARKHIASVYFGQPVDQSIYDNVRGEIEKGLRALCSLTSFSAFIAGDSFTYADITAYFQIRFANLHTTQIYDWDLCKEDPAMASYLGRVGERKTILEVDGVLQRDFAAFKAKS